MEAIITLPTKGSNNKRKRRKQVGSGTRGPKIKLSETAIRLYNRQKVLKSHQYGRRRLAKYLNVSEDKIRTALEQLEYFGYINLHLAEPRKKKDGSALSKRPAGYHVEKIYGAADRIELRDLDNSLFASTKRNPKRRWDLSDREKIIKRKQVDQIENLILDDSDASTVVRLCKSVGVRTLSFVWDGSTLQKPKRAPDRNLPQLLIKAAKLQRNLFCRPDGATYGTLIQLDEVGHELLDKLRPFSFLQIETSPHNFQSWLALPINTPVKMRNRVRDRLAGKVGKLKAVDPKINLGAHGAFRMVGSRNQKYADVTVKLIHADFGNIVRSSELAQVGLLGPPQKRTTGKFVIASKRIEPDQKYIDMLVKRHAGKHNRLAAMVVHCLQQGFRAEEVLERVRRSGGGIGEKVAERGDAWTMQVIKNQIEWMNRKSS